MSIAIYTPSSDLSPVTARVERLRAVAVERAHTQLSNGEECTLLAVRSWWRTGDEASHMLRRGVMAGDILRGMTPVIDPDELLVGKYARRTLSAEEQVKLAHWRNYGEPATSKAHGQRAHMAIDYERVLRLGVAGVQAQITQYRAYP